MNSNIILYTTDSGNVSVQVQYEDGTFWLTQKRIAEIRIVQQEGKREVSRVLDFYNLDAIIAVGYRVNSMQATQFRI